MESDRELLLLAAKAAGMTLMNVEVIGSGIATTERGYWNPLTDDGDALRLAVKLGMQAPFELLMHTGGAEANFLDVTKAQVVSGIDHFAATRRAIVRAAAAIGRDAKEDA